MSALVSVQEYEAQAAQLFTQAKAILTNSESTPEDIAKVDQMVTDAQQLKLKAFKLEEVSKAADEIATKADAKTAPVGSKDFGSWEEFVSMAVKGFAQRKTDRDPRLVAWRDIATPDERKDLVEGVGASGGFLVPTEFYNQLMSVDGEAGIVRPRRDQDPYAPARCGYSSP